jgi:hypothetical protein
LDEENQDIEINYKKNVYNSKSSALVRKLLIELLKDGQDAFSFS